MTAAAIAPPPVVASASRPNGHTFAFPQKSSVTVQAAIVLIAPYRRSASGTDEQAREEHGTEWVGVPGDADERQGEDGHDAGDREDR